MEDQEVTTTVNEMQREYFDQESLDLYFRFLAERQSIYARRLRGANWPWTSDPLLLSEFITNVYRAQDPGTVYLVNNILSVEGATAGDIVFNVMLYRVMGSVPSTHEHLGFQKCEEFNATEFQARLAELPDEHRIFGDAYRVASYHQEGGGSKVANVATTFHYLAGGMPETMRRIDAARSVIEVYKVFEAMKGLGEFLAHQIVVDLLYSNSRGEAVVPFGENQFAKAGPGARKGIWNLIGEGFRPANMLIVMNWLHANQEAEFDRIGVLFPWAVDAMGDRIQMSLCDIQASLCEFHKYYRLWNGDRKAQVRKYDPSQQREVDAPWELDPDACQAALMRTDSWTYQKAVEEALDALEAADEPSGASSEVLDPEDGGKSIGYEEEEVKAGAETGEFLPASTLSSVELVPGVTLNITINVYPPR